MSEMNCEAVADLLPDWIADRLGPAEAARVDAHVRACADCAADAAVVRALRAARPAVPAGLSDRIAAGLREDEVAVPAAGGAWSGWRRWATSAAAVLVLAVGTFVLRAGDPAASVDLGAVAVEESVWIADDGIVAGAPVLDGLSEDALAALLEEME
jgi:hypothetical protein